MKKFRGFLILLAVVLVCVGAVKLTLHFTAEYPSLGKPVSYPVNQVDGFTLTTEKPIWSPFKGYTIRWTVSAESNKRYTFQDSENNYSFERLERLVDGQWYRLNYTQEYLPLSNPELELGGSVATESIYSSIVQKYAYYGTRLEPGTYRVTLEMWSREGTPHYLASEFNID